MRARRRRAAIYTDEGGLDLTSLLDVIFNLVFFFVVATNIKTQQHFLELALPKSSEAPAGARAPEELPEVTIDREGRIFLNGKPLRREELVPQLKKILDRTKARRVVLSAAALATVQQSVDVMDAIREAGALEVTQRVEKRP